MGFSGTVQDISLRPLTFRTGMITLVEKRIEYFENKHLVLFP
jgi:hypothetical protein